MGIIVLVGDPDADPLILPLDAELDRRGHRRVVVPPGRLSVACITVTDDACTLEGDHVGAVVFRASPSLLVAPEFTSEDAGFASAEFRAVWAHVLALPGMVAVNRAHADAWFSSSERLAWLRRIGDSGVATAPRRIGLPWEGGRWILWTGGMRALPEAGVCERMGVASIAPGPLARAFCCAGAVIDDSGDGARFHDVARACLDSGLVLAGITLDTAGRLVDVEPVPPIPPALAPAVAHFLGDWIDAAVRG